METRLQLYMILEGKVRRGSERERTFSFKFFFVCFFAAERKRQWRRIELDFRDTHNTTGVPVGCKIRDKDAQTICYFPTC